jgi:hypothetical protein
VISRRCGAARVAARLIPACASHPRPQILIAVTSRPATSGCWRLTRTGSTATATASAAKPDQTAATIIRATRGWDPHQGPPTLTPVIGQGARRDAGERSGMPASRLAVAACRGVVRSTSYDLEAGQRAAEPRLTATHRRPTMADMRRLDRGMTAWADAHPVAGAIMTGLVVGVVAFLLLWPLFRGRGLGWLRRSVGRCRWRWGCDLRQGLLPPQGPRVAGAPPAGSPLARS